MKNTVTATELARNIGDILSRIRYRRESFLIERNGRPVARIVPFEAAREPTVREAQESWPAGADEEPASNRPVRGRAARRAGASSTTSAGQRRKRNGFAISRGRTPITADTVRDVDALDDRR